MKTRYSSLVTVKKSTMQESERVLQSANTDLKSASLALESSYAALKDVQLPQAGKMAGMLASKTLLESQRNLILHNKEWQEFAQNKVNVAKEKLQKDMIEYEKFNYLNTEEMKKMLQEKKLQESKDLDEVALMTHTRKKVIA